MTDRIEVLCEDDLQSRLPPDECAWVVVERDAAGNVHIVNSGASVKVSARDQKRLAEFFAGGASNEPAQSTRDIAEALIARLEGMTPEERGAELEAALGRLRDAGIVPGCGHWVADAGGEG